VQECADDLAEVTETLAKGVEDIKQVELALAGARAALVATQSALAEAQVHERQATFRAMHDAATGLPNRGLFDDRLAHGIALAERHDWTLAVMFIDLDRFKSVNDDHGHAAGDHVLQEVARRLSEHARDEDTVCRNGGDEFLYLLMNPQGIVNVERKAAAVLQSICQPVESAGRELVVACSIGIAIYPQHGRTGVELIGHADTAMYRAKKHACGSVVFDSEN
jgi:diguanylate cyclase (GGDEF)-like protein